MDFHARDDSKEMLCRSIHARDDIEEIYVWRDGPPIFCQLLALTVRDASLMSLINNGGGNRVMLGHNTNCLVC